VNHAEFEAVVQQAMDTLPDWVHQALEHIEMDELREEIATTLIHEIAHYFGIDDDHLDDIGWG
jgi:predicted Zn-dependent protease with MMP-like domain